MTNLATVPLPQDEDPNYGATITQVGARIEPYKIDSLSEENAFGFQVYNSQDWGGDLQRYYRSKKLASSISVVDPSGDEVDDRNSLSSIPPYEEVDEEPSEGFRGVFPVNKKRKVIATFQVKFKLSELKRRTPTVILEGPQSLREDD